MKVEERKDSCCYLNRAAWGEFPESISNIESIDNGKLNYSSVVYAVV